MSKKLRESTPEDRYLVVKNQGQEYLSAWKSKTEIAVETEYQKATVAYTTLGELLDRLDAARKEITGPINKALRAANGQAKVIAKPLQDVREHIKDLMIGYQMSLRAQAAQAAELEAKRAEKRGDKQFAEDIRDAAEATKLPESESLFTRENAKTEVTDMKKFLLAILEGKLPMDLVEVNYTKLNALLKVHGEEKFEDMVPGACVKKETVFVRK